MTQKSEIGKLGEDIACEYLKNNGYKIIERNFRKPWGELDIIAKDSDGTLAFVEVKTIKTEFDLNPEENLSKSKLKKLQRTALLYTGSNQHLVKDNRGWRMDLIAININNCQDNLTDKKISDISHNLRHYKNI